LRDRIQTVINGGVADMTPFTIYQGIWEIISPSTAMDIPELGVVACPRLYEVTYENVELLARHLDDGSVEHTIVTPLGQLHKATRRESGYGSTWTVQHYVKHPDDYEVLAYLLEHSSVKPSEAALRQAQAAAGDRGVLLAWMPRAPFQRTWIEYTGIERLVFDLQDCPEVVHHIFDLMLEDSRKVWNILAGLPITLLWCPDNITSCITGRRWFEEYLLPYYEQAAAVLHPAGKKLCCHLDGLLRDIAGLIARTPIDVVEAYNPPPDGDVTVAEALRIWPDKVIWANFPSSMHLASEDEIEALTRELIAQAAPGHRFLLGVMEDIPAQVGDRSLRAIARAIRQAAG